MISLKPPVVPRPSIGGAPKADTTAPRTSRWQRVAQRRGDGVGRQLRAAALVELLEHHVHRAQVRGVGVEDQRLAGDAHRVRDPGRLAGDLSRSAPSRCRSARTEAESGSCTFSSR